jgi:hypothetical protein
MTKSEALALLRSGTELTEEQRVAIATAIESVDVDDDWENSSWNSSYC